MENSGMSFCGIYDCGKCAYLSPNRCLGCAAENARIAQGSGNVCRIYECVQSRAVSTCRNCSESSCSLRGAAELTCPLRSRFEKPRWWAGRIARALESRGTTSGARSRDDKSKKVITRLRWYLTALESFADQGCKSVSSWQLAEKVGVSSALVRKDLSKFGDFGKRSLGYDVAYLRKNLRSILCRSKSRDIVWIGAKALRLHRDVLDGVKKHECVVRAVFDEGDEVGTKVGDLTVKPTSAIREELSERPPAVAVVAVDGFLAHCIAGLLVDIGVHAILNLSGEFLSLPPHVRVTNFDLVGELLELCYYCE